MKYARNSNEVLPGVRPTKKEGDQCSPVSSFQSTSARHLMLRCHMRGGWPARSKPPCTCSISPMRRSSVPSSPTPLIRDTAVLNRLDDCLTDEDRQHFRAVTAVEHADAPADEILRYAQLRDVDLIVMGTHGHKGMTHVLLGSVAEKVVRGATCPVSDPSRRAPIVRHNADVAHAYSGDHRLQSTLRSSAGIRTLDSVQVWRFTSLVARDGRPRRCDLVRIEVFVPDSPEVRAARLKEAQDQLAHRVRPDDREQPRATTEVIEGSAARTISRYAADNGFDLIVMGTHGRMGIAHLMMGSVAEQVVRAAPCPVLSTRISRQEMRGAQEREGTAEPVPRRNSGR